MRQTPSPSIAASNITASGTSYGIVSGEAMGITASNINATGSKGAVKAKSALQLVGMTGGSAEEKNDRWYVMNGSDKATKVSLKY
jgi:hypothetical protein